MSWRKPREERGYTSNKIEVPKGKQGRKHLLPKAGDSHLFQLFLDFFFLYDWENQSKAYARDRT